MADGRLIDRAKDDSYVAALNATGGFGPPPQSTPRQGRAGQGRAGRRRHGRR